VKDLIVFTGYSGYGEKLDDPGERESLKLHVIAISRNDGTPKWTLTLDPSPEEQEATPRVADHGYASPTPCTDGEKIYAAFGPSGVVCCSLDGKEIWRTSIGTGVAGFGAAASPIVHEDLVYINAAIESNSLVALDKNTGDIVWQVEDINRAWTTPIIVTPKSGTPELAMHHKDLIRGYNPKTGDVLWTCRGIPDYVVPGIVVVDDVLYCSGGRQNRTIAVKSGGRGDVTETHKLWEVTVGANVTTPLFHNGYLFWSHDKGMAQCLNAEDGSTLFRERYESRDRVYASIALGDGRLYAQLRDGTCLVIAAGPEYTILAENKLGDGEEQFNATPAFDEGRIIFRSTKAVYCVAK
jgi:outer membrane protein assembly factor BamB